MSSLDTDIQALVEQTSAALMKAVTAAKTAPTQGNWPAAGRAARAPEPPSVAKEERTLKKPAKPRKLVVGDEGKKVEKAILISLNVRKKAGLTAAELLPLMPAGTSKLALSYRLRLLRAAGSVRQEGGRKQARYLKVYAKG